MENNPSSDDAMSQSDGNAPESNASPVLPDDLLPLVEPPSARFIVQLFLIPAIIVAGVVGVWFLVNGLVNSRTTDPATLVQSLERSGVMEWQQAQTLTNLLRNKRNDKLRDDPKLVQQLGGILQRGIESKDMQEKAVTMRHFLCKAIGEFRVDDALPALIQAATTGRKPEELSVQIAALESIALLSHSMKTKDAAWPGQQEELVAALNSLSRSEDQPRIRSATALVYGELGTAESITALKRLSDDPYADAQYNAAIALAKLGDAAAIDTLAEMLDFTEDAGIRLEKKEILKPHKRTVISVNAMRATKVLVDKNREADVTELAQLMKKIVNADAETRKKAYLQSSVISEAKVTLDYLIKKGRD